MKDKVKIFKQKHDCDCALAAVANLRGIDQEYFIPKRLALKVKEQGTSYDSEVIKALRCAGYRNNKDYERIYPHRVDGVIEKMLEGRKALLSIPSLNNRGGFHMVFWDGFSIIDPSTKRTYCQLNNTYINSIFLFKVNE